LAPLSDNAQPGIRYFSGTATYRTSVNIGKLHLGQKAFLNLGTVGDIAKVTVNDVPVGIAWQPPFRVDVTSALKPGDNRLQIEIADLWVNRLIADQRGQGEKITFTTIPTYKPDAPLRLSGLVGPVEVLTTP
jgi:hypothetical protein